MPKSRRGTALFELLAENEVAADDALRARPGKGLRGQVVHPPEVKFPTPQEGERIPPIRPNPLRGGAVELEGERVRLSLTTWSAALIAFIGIGLIVGAFELGRSFGDQAQFELGYAAGKSAYVADTVDEIETARRQPPSTDLISSLLQAPVPDNERSVTPPAQAAEPAVDRSPSPVGAERVASPSAPAGQASRSGGSWIQGYTYVVAQEFSSGRDEDAERAQEFLADNGVRTEMVRYSSGSIQLITVQGYNRDDSTQRRMADKLLDKVKAIGKRYFSEGGGYRLDGYFKKLTGESW